MTKTQTITLRPALWPCKACNTLHDVYALRPCDEPRTLPSVPLTTAIPLASIHYGADGWDLIQPEDVAATRIRTIGQARHGEDWWQPLADELGVSLRNLQRMAGGRWEAPDGLWQDLLALRFAALPRRQACARCEDTGWLPQKLLDDGSQLMERACSCTAGKSHARPVDKP